jgi:hypothetical protein
MEAVRNRIQQSVEMRGVVPSLHHLPCEQGKIYHVETVVRCYV